jgi:hypothetical protein
MIYIVGSLVPVTVEKWFLIITTTPGGAQANPVFSKLSFATSKSESKNLTTKTAIFFSFLQISTCGNTKFRTTCGNTKFQYVRPKVFLILVFPQVLT